MADELPAPPPNDVASGAASDMPLSDTPPWDAPPSDGAPADVEPPASGLSSETATASTGQFASAEAESGSTDSTGEGSEPPVSIAADAPTVASADGTPLGQADEPLEESVAVSVAGDELEELTLPSSVQAPEALAVGTRLGPEGRLEIVEHLGARGRINRYAATWQDEAGHELSAELREGPADHVGLRREADILAEARYGMLPTYYAGFEHDGRWYLAIERLEGETLDRAFLAGLDLERVLSIVLQLAQALRRLHGVGWALVGLAPADVVLGQPVRIVQLANAARIGEASTGALHIAGYSAPELAHADPIVTGKEDVYTLGAILYRALVGQPVPEAGAELSQLPALVPVPGGPQLLIRALAPTDERADLETFYRELLALKQRFAQAATTIALEVASGTTVGLNPTRPVNEDSCGYVTWAVAGAEGVVYRALLCVADGMGGMEAGEVASGTALRVVLSATTIPPPPDGEAESPPGPAAPADRLDPAALIRRAAPIVHAAGQGRQMGTTCTVVTVHGDELTLGHVGDTRAYLLREGVLTQLTNDHSLVAAMVASGVLSKEEARGHPDSNKVLRSLGGHRELPERYVDSLAEAYGEPSLQLRPGDWLVLCTDGIWGSVDDGTIRDVTVAAPDPQTVARILVERALAAGAPDNAAVVAARCVLVPAA